MINIKAQILKIINGGMTAISNGIVYNCEPNGKSKKSKIMVGDIVELEENNYGDKYVVSKIEKRKNSLLRPPLCNIDNLFIIMSKLPKTDYLLVDKLIIYCRINNIKPYIIVNKIDLYTEEEINDLRKQFSPSVEDIIFVSGKQKVGIDKILQYLPKNLSVFAGQSAVGKSTILNAISPNLNLSTNDLSKKIGRGKHTTRHSEIYILDDNIMIADTPGFSLLDLDIDIEPKDLSKYYVDFEEFLDCKYSNCDHTNLQDKDCMLARAVIDEKVDKNRYIRYTELYKKLREKWRKKYD